MTELKENLKLAATGDLIDELMLRFPNAMFIGLKEDGYKDSRIWWEITGLKIECSGLYAEMKERLEDHFGKSDYDIQ